MEAVRLMQITSRMEAGQCYEVNAADMREAAASELPSLLFDGPVRKNDVENFIAKIEHNWKLVIKENLQGNWIITKLRG